MKLFTVASKLCWGDWLKGSVGALISGGAGSISAGFATKLADPDHDIHVFEVMWITFAISGVVSLAKYLQTHPLPEEKQS